MGFLRYMQYTFNHNYETISVFRRSLLENGRNTSMPMRAMDGKLLSCRYNDNTCDVYLKIRHFAPMTLSFNRLFPTLETNRLRFISKVDLEELIQNGEIFRKKLTKFVDN